MPCQYVTLPIFIALFFATAVVDADEPADSGRDAQLAKELIGSWRIIDAHLDGKPSAVHYSAVTIKHITPSQFTWLSYKPDDREIFRSMGGTWEVRDGKYIETARYGADRGFREKNFGRVTEIECTLENDVFTQIMTGKNGSKFVEVWQRILPGEDPDQIPMQK